MHVTQKQYINEFHPVVQELARAGYNVEQSIKAVEHSEELEGALDYLLSLGGEGGIFPTLTSVLAEEEKQYWEEREAEFMEESQKEEPLYVFHPHVSLTIAVKSHFPCNVITVCQVLDRGHCHMYRELDY